LPFVGYNLNEGTIEADFEAFDIRGTRHIYHINDGGAGFKGFAIRCNNTTQIATISRDGSAFNVSNNSTDISANTLVKTSATYDGLGRTNLSVNGVLAGSSDTNTVNLTAHDEVNFFGGGGLSAGGTSPYELSGILKRFAYYASRLKDDFVKRLS